MPTFDRLVAGRHDVVAVVCQPDRPRGRGRRPSPAPVARRALEEGLPLLRPERVGTPECAEELRGFEADLGVVVAFGQFLPRRIRELPRLGYLINGHASLLPRHRGAAPIAHAILAGDTETGVSVMRVEREMDAGPVATLRRTAIGADETCGELTERIAALTAEAIAEALEEIAAGTVKWVDQDAALATEAPKLDRDDALLDFREDAAALARRVRALAPRPGARTRHGDEPLRVLAARALPGPVPDPPGTLRCGDVEPLRVATGDGWLALDVLQRAGGRALAAAELQRGRSLADGVRLG